MRSRIAHEWAVTSPPPTTPKPTPTSASTTPSSATTREPSPPTAKPSPCLCLSCGRSRRENCCLPLGGDAKTRQRCRHCLCSVCSGCRASRPRGTMGCITGASCRDYSHRKVLQNITPHSHATRKCAPRHKYPRSPTPNVLPTRSPAESAPPGTPQSPHSGASQPPCRPSAGDGSQTPPAGSAKP